MSPDWAAAPTTVPYAELSDPQTLNLYGYVRNNPLWQADVDGHGWWQKLKNWATDGGWTDDDKQAEQTRQQRLTDRARFYANEWAKEHPNLHFDPSKFSDAVIVDAFKNGAFSKVIPGDKLDPLQMLGIVNAVVGPGNPGGQAQSTGRTQPADLKEQLAMEQAQSSPTSGQQVPVKGGMQDPRWPGSQGWVKMRQNINGVEIHYVRNVNTGEVADFKFK